MAEAVSLAAGTLTIVNHARVVSTFLSDHDKSQNNLSAAVKLEIEIYSEILEEIGQIALSGTSRLPRSATLSLQLCELHLSNVERIIRRNVEKITLSTAIRWPEAGDLEKHLGSYRRSVKILRDIVMDVITQELLRKDGNERSSRMHGAIHIENVIDTTQGTDMIEKQVETIIQQLGTMFSSGDVQTGPVHISNRFTDRAVAGDGLSEDVLDNLRRAAEGINASSSATQSTPNPFEFYARILRDQEHSEEESNVCAKFDTGSEDNWISAAIVNRVGLHDRLELTQLGKLYTGADGNMFQPMGVVSVPWTRNSIKSWQTDFLVLENAPFDMLLGRKFIIEEGLFVFADPVLVTDLTRLAPFSKEDYHKMEQKLRERGVQNEELSRTRELKDAAARERRRAEKAASRMSLATSRMSVMTTPGSMTPASFRPTPSMQSQADSMGSGVADGDASQATSGAQDEENQSVSF
ncbi:uncharacterized protein K460DRAFT_416352 [Cucurbitaria berberidis CBS 394.84]|uniref:Uncharacterized protein n=1 Tax=Cucurbitaria berberidis CBS 394.84 TaxID=1168544 RepID=A0A9P4GGW8_9PLEO|nr:uncharacterized protein K460DRAFT_416352 [Cucurbitaria berberidis CBS 394.84]KAF1845021.1 hypothetical protein K460DRAFT_416352 [Cucurbitaria berberidis CBS 394.84]